MRSWTVTGLALESLDVNAARTRFVVGSPDDIAGANRVGMTIVRAIEA
jgi:hypothetical protein